ncbi:hypothetical protein [Limimaricola pyoseonensis]|uniref:Uncharacterized protein n=1 Tax=Limimaricola pyoseonensis TaxID=521013 RepID=A0A1G7J2U3_9RHOB|nr:hypothetical protein [Limimaricola pyoseonensis]SDF19193.1 hypothetical protein SAMN04488567_3622 [Limimaricola pyoseonensis]
MTQTVQYHRPETLADWLDATAAAPEGGPERFRRAAIVGALSSGMVERCGCEASLRRAAALLREAPFSGDAVSAELRRQFNSTQLRLLCARAEERLAALYLSAPGLQDALADDLALLMGCIEAAPLAEAV